MGEHNQSLCNFDAKLDVLTYMGYELGQPYI